MRLVINIPCYNEAETLPLVLGEIPTAIAGVTEIIVQIVDDGSTDATAEIARQFGCRLVSISENLGLGNAFNRGAFAALELGADVMVNTDGDNQYPGQYIPDLVLPILQGKADIVIGNRDPGRVSYFSRSKKILQRLGNWAVQWLIGGYLPDTVSGFRAYSSEALMRLNAITRYSYTLDTLVQANHKGLKAISVPITTNPPTRPSRLFNNLMEHVFRSIQNILTVYIVYEPFRFLATLSLVPVAPAIFYSLRFLYHYMQGQGGGNVQSLIASAIGFTLGGLLLSLGVLGGLVAHLRYLIEQSLYLQKREMYFKSRGRDSDSLK